MAKTTGGGKGGTRVTLARLLQGALCRRAVLLGRMPCSHAVPRCLLLVWRPPKRVLALVDMLVDTLAQGAAAATRFAQSRQVHGQVRLRRVSCRPVFCWSWLYMRSICVP